MNYLWTVEGRRIRWELLYSLVWYLPMGIHSKKSQHFHYMFLVLFAILPPALQMRVLEARRTCAAPKSLAATLGFPRGVAAGPGQTKTPTWRWDMLSPSHSPTNDQTDNLNGLLVLCSVLRRVIFPASMCHMTIYKYVFWTSHFLILQIRYWHQLVHLSICSNNL